MRKEELLGILEEAVAQGRTELNLSEYELTELPSELGNLTQMKKLDLSDNQLTVLSPELGKLTQMKTLELSNNNLTKLPSELGNLSQMKKLDLSDNLLMELPSELGNLTQMIELDLSDNNLTELPSELGKLTQLKTLRLDGNPLDDALAIVAERKIDDVLAYLRSLADAEPLYEAKLIFVGEGRVGKSCLLAALTGKGFLEDLSTTHGIDIQRLDLPHPVVDKTLRLNAWDFGGQKVYRITHQFFYSRRSLYLLLWNQRMGPEQCDVRGWIERIQLRIGDEARILIVATHCETGERVTRIDQHDLLRDHGDVIVGFHEIDSKTGAGIDELKTAISTAAAKLPQMGNQVSTKWRAARDELREFEDPQIPFKIFTAICSEHGLDKEATHTLGGLLHDLGDIVFFGDEAGLQDVVVLQPGWLTKAIGFVLEDRETNREHGVLRHGRLRSIWHDHDIADREQYDPHLHPYFLRLMEEYDVSYRLEGEKSSLVAQLVPEVRPHLPWTPEGPATPGEPQISLVCELAEEPPGLVPWMIVRTHRFASVPRSHWQRGMYLEYGEHGTALAELRRREFHITVRAAWPDYFMSVLRFTLEALIRSRWEGLKTRFSVPCPGLDEFGRQCRGRFPLRALHKYKARGRIELDCMSDCLRSFDIHELLTGFRVPAPPIKSQLDRIEQNQVETKRAVAGAASAAAANHMALMRALAAENRDCPRLFTLLPEEIGGLTPTKIGKIRQRLTLWCEYPDGPHPTCLIGSDGDGEYTFESAKEWLVEIAPYAKIIASALRTVLPIAGAGIKVALDESVLKNVEPEIRLMEKVASTLLKGEFEISDRQVDTKRLVSRAEHAGLRELHHLLLELDPQKNWGNLSRALAKTGEYLWLCPKHYREYEPDLIELD